ncbi:MAG TPA: GNAT family protein [Candidatus Limnocylindrales bacterium]|nr:GNAT family protein [Candidatus Limnocylindrales bacterium]
MEIIRTDRLELVPLLAAFVDAVRQGDRAAAERAIGARVSRWLMREPSHLVQLLLAQSGPGAGGPGVVGWLVVAVGRSGRRRVIGSAGFHGPPDERGRLEIGCVIEPASRRRGYAAEAMRTLVLRAVEDLGITRFVVAVPSILGSSGGTALEIGYGPADWPGDTLRALLGEPARTRPPAR